MASNYDGRGRSDEVRPYTDDSALIKICTFLLVKKNCHIRVQKEREREESTQILLRDIHIEIDHTITVEQRQLYFVLVHALAH